MGILRGFQAIRAGFSGKSAVDTRWVLARKTVEGVKTVKARLVAGVFQGPELTEGAVDTSECLRLRLSALQVISLRATKNGEYGPWIEKGFSPSRWF